MTTQIPPRKDLQDRRPFDMSNIEWDKAIIETKL